MFSEYFGHLYVEMEPQTGTGNGFILTINIPREKKNDPETQEILQDIRNILNHDDIWRVAEIAPPSFSEGFERGYYGLGQRVTQCRITGHVSPAPHNAVLTYKFIENRLLEGLEEKYPPKRSGMRNRFSPVDRPELIPDGYSHNNTLQEGIKPWYNRDYLSFQGKDGKRYFLVTYNDMQSLEKLYDLAKHPDFLYSVFNNKIHHGDNREITLPLPDWRVDKNETLPWQWVTRKLMDECRTDKSFLREHPELDTINPDAKVVCIYIREVYGIKARQRDNSLLLTMEEGDKLPPALCIKEFYDHELKNEGEWCFNRNPNEWQEFAKQLVNDHGAPAGGAEFFPADELFDQPLPLPEKDRVIYLGIGTYIWPDYQGRGLGARMTAEVIHYLQYHMRNQEKELGLASGCALNNIASMSNILQRGMEPLLDANGRIVIMDTAYEDGPRPVFFMRGDAIDKLVHGQPERRFTPRQILEMVKEHHPDNKAAVEWVNKGLEAIKARELAGQRAPVGKYTAAVVKGGIEQGKDTPPRP